MTDRNTLFLQTASSVINELDVRYTSTSAPKAYLKEELDKAMMTFAEIRCRILENEISCTAEDVTSIQEVHQGLAATRDVQALIPLVTRFTGILARL